MARPQPPSPSPVLALTTGEPAGIGPELALQLAAAETLPAALVAVGDPQLLAERAALLGLEVALPVLAPGMAVPAHRPGVLPVWPVALREPSRPGRLATGNAAYVLETLDVAIAACRSGQADGMVTAPLHKGVILDAGHAGFRGHTEYLRDACGVDEVVMMLATDSALHARQPEWAQGKALRVALATTHLPLREVAEAISGPGLARILRILHDDLQRWFGIEAPHIAVCGLNPHAGEGGIWAARSSTSSRHASSGCAGRGCTWRSRCRPTPCSHRATWRGRMPCWRCIMTKACRCSSTPASAAPPTSPWACRWCVPRSITARRWTWPGEAWPIPAACA